MMSMTYVFPDLHGRFDQFNAAMAALDAQPDDTLVFLGDYIDRGPESAQLVRALRDLQDGRPNVICLSGNHEMMMVWSMLDHDTIPGWLANGGITTIESYTDGFGVLDAEGVASDCEWFQSLPLYYTDEHRVYVHAGVDPDADLNEQFTKDVHWMRYGASDGEGYRGKHVVHGHTPDATGPVTFGNRTAMDVGAVWTGRYVVGVFDDNVPGGLVRVIEVTA
jgi:serine/threonine protein phosphatase 1